MFCIYGFCFHHSNSVTLELPCGVSGEKTRDKRGERGSSVERDKELGKDKGTLEGIVVGSRMQLFTVEKAADL